MIAHRGASGYRPEHTLASYRLAMALGADYVEPDLVSTRDGELVARHESEISATTDIAFRSEFAGRRTTKVIAGRPVTGWFVEDLTLAELRTLRAIERLPLLRPRNTRFDGRYRIPTFDEILALVRSESGRLGRAVGVCPELKNPSYSAAIGLPMEEVLARALRRHQALMPRAPVFVQSFEPTCLRRLSSLVAAPLVQLVGPSGAYADLVTPLGLREVSTYAVVIGAHKDVLLPTNIVSEAHSVGLEVHAWTFRDENRGDPTAEYQAFFDLGVDGVFTDHTDTAVAALAAHPVSWGGGSLSSPQRGRDTGEPREDQHHGDRPGEVLDSEAAVLPRGPRRSRAEEDQREYQRHDICGMAAHGRITLISPKDWSKTRVQVGIGVVGVRPEQVGVPPTSASATRPRASSA